MKKLSIRTIAVMVLVLFCTSAWAKTKYDNDYPESEFLTATGIGQSEPEARKQALAELSRIFESRIKSDATDKVRLSVKASGAESMERDMMTQVSLASDVELKGAKIGAAWQEKGTYYALAVLEKKGARENWESQIGNIDGKSKAILDSLATLNSKLIKYKSMRKVTEMWVEREVAASRLRVIGYRTGEPMGYEINSIFKKIEELKASMTVAIAVKGDNEDAFNKGIAEAIGAAGFAIVMDPKIASVVIEGTSSVGPVDIKNPDMKYARAAATLTVIDREAGISIGSVSDDKRGAHLSYGEAAKKALNKVIPAITEKLMGYLKEEAK